MKLLLVPIALASGCVLSPLDQSTVSDKLAPLEVTGYGSQPDAKIIVKSWDHDRSVWEPIAVTRTGTRAIGRDTPLYGYNVGRLYLGERYWHPTAWTCDATSMGRLEVNELYRGTQYALGTFQNHDCLTERLRAGDDFAAAGVECHTGRNVLMFAAAQCTTVPATPTELPYAVLRINDGVENAWEVQGGSVGVPVAGPPASRPLRVTADGFDLDGVRTVRITGEGTLTCDSAAGPVTRRDTYNTRADQPGAIGSTVDVMLGTTLDIDLPGNRTRCPAGSTPRSYHGRLTATAIDFLGQTVTTAAQPFHVSYSL